MTSRFIGVLEIVLGWKTDYLCLFECCLLACNSHVVPLRHHMLLLSTMCSVVLALHYWQHSTSVCNCTDLVIL